jgi:hypothetical protein
MRMYLAQLEFRKILCSVDFENPAHADLLARIWPDSSLTNFTAAAEQITAVSAPTAPDQE